MSIQAQFNKEAIDMLPNTKKALQESGKSNFATLNRINNAYKPIAKMSADELQKFDEELANLV